MVYIDENGNVLESVDLNLGHLEDAEWIDHPEIEQTGHYEYEKLNENGGQIQKYIIDTPWQPAYREVTKQRYILYTEEELASMAKANYAQRLEDLESGLKAQEENQEQTNTLLSAQVQAVSDRSDFVEDCIAEMAAIVYA